MDVIGITVTTGLLIFNAVTTGRVQDRLQTCVDEFVLSGSNTNVEFRQCIERQFPAAFSNSRARIVNAKINNSTKECR